LVRRLVQNGRKLARGGLEEHFFYNRNRPNIQARLCRKEYFLYDQMCGLQIMLCNELTDITLDPALAMELDLSLQQQLVDAMSNGDLFIPELPLFELYQTKISFGCNKAKVEMDVIGIECAVGKGQLLKEFFF